MTTFKCIFSDGSSQRLFLRDAQFHRPGASLPLTPMEEEREPDEETKEKCSPIHWPEFEKECLGWIRNVVMR